MTAEEPVNKDSILEFDEMEGQEAILVEAEEEVPVQKQASVKKKLAKGRQGGEKRKRLKKKRSLFKKSVDVESREEKDEVEQVSPKQVTKTMSKTRVVLLDPADYNETKKKQAAAHRVEYSRKLLEVALRPHNKATAGITEEEREKMTRAAFQQAAEARRLVEGEVDEDLATVISENASKGEAAATKAQCILYPKNAGTGASNTEGSIGKDKVVKQGEKEEKQADSKAWHNRKYTPKDLFEEAEMHANKARQHLEAILPVFECLPSDHESLPPQQMLPTQGFFTDANEECTLSTLGFDNTFQETVLSITSLNEILDAPLSSSESKVNAPGSAQAEDTDSVKKGRLGLFKRLSQKGPKTEPKECSTAQDALQTTSPNASKSSNEDKSSAKLKEEKERPVERFIATVVQNDDENSVCSDISNSSELERIKALETRTDSKLKEAMENDETGSLCSWHGVPLFAEATSPETEKQTKDKGKKKVVEDKPLLVRDHEHGQGRAQSFKELKPQFVTAPDFNPKVLTSRSWDDAVAEKEEAELKENEEELAKAKKKKWGLLGWGRHGTDKQADKEGSAPCKTQTKNGDSGEMQGDSDAIVAGDTPPGKVDDLANMNEIGAPSIKSNEEGGDRYAIMSKGNDTAGESEKEQVRDGADMMPYRPNPMDVRNASSLDAEQRAVDDSDDIKFADVEIGTEQVEKKIMSRETVMQKIKAPRSSKVSAEANNLERVRTLPSVEGMSDIEPSASMIDEIEKQNESKKADKKVDKQQSRFLKRVFGKSKRNKSSATSGFEDSGPPAMCLVNTGSSSDSAQKAGMQTENETVEASLL